MIVRIGAVGVGAGLRGEEVGGGSEALTGGVYLA